MLVIPISMVGQLSQDYNVPVWTFIVNWASNFVQPPRRFQQQKSERSATHSARYRREQFCKQHNLPFTLQLSGLLETFCQVSPLPLNTWFVSHGIIYGGTPHPCQRSVSRRNKRLGIYVMPKVKYSWVAWLKCKGVVLKKVSLLYWWTQPLYYDEAIIWISSLSCDKI